MKKNYQKGGGTYPNLFDAHPPFQIDGNFGGSAAVAEMLVQSTPDLIELLPAVPKAWSSGKVSGLKARGGYEISMQWEGGQVKNVVIKSKNSASVRVRMNGEIKVIKTIKI